MGTITGAGKIVLAAASHHFKAVIQINAQCLFERQQAWFPVDKRQHNDTERVLKRCVLEQVLQHLCRIGIAFALNDDT